MYPVNIKVVYKNIEVVKEIFRNFVFFKNEERNFLFLVNLFIRFIYLRALSYLSWWFCSLCLQWNFASFQVESFAVIIIFN